MSEHRPAATVAIALAVVAAAVGCGSSDPDVESPNVLATPKEDGAIESFDAQLVSPTAVRVSYSLSRPARLALLVSGTKRASASGAIPFDAKGNFPSSTSPATTSPAGSGQARIHFERGEFNFSGSPRLRFSLRATYDGHHSRSDTVTRNRDGLFGRKNVRRAIRSVDEGP